MNSPFKTLDNKQTQEMNKIMNRLQDQTKYLSQYRISSYHPCRQCGLEGIWNQLDNQITLLYSSTKTMTQYSNKFILQEVKIFHQTGNRQVSKIQSIATQMLIELSEKKSSNTVVRMIAAQAEPHINSMLKQLEKIIVQFTAISFSFLQKNLQTPQNLNNSFNKKQDDKKFEALISERQQNLKKAHKQRQNKIKEEEEKQKEILKQQISKHENDYKANMQKIKTLEDTIVRQKTQEEISKLQIEELKRLLKAQQQKRTKLQEQKRLKVQEQQQKLKNKSLEQLNPLQQKINLTKQQLAKLQEQANRYRNVLELSKKQDYKSKQLVEVKAYQLKGKMEELERVTGEVVRVNRFVQVQVNERLVGLIEELGKIIDNQGRRIIQDKSSNKQGRVNNGFSINFKFMKQLQEKTIHTLNNLQSLIAHLKHDFIQLQTKLSTNSKQLTSLQQKLSASSTTVTTQRQQYQTRQKQLRQLERKYQAFASFQSLLEANKQQSRKYEQISYQIKEKRQAYETEKDNIQNLKQQYNNFLKDRFGEACNIQELHSRIEYLTKQKQNISSTVQQKYAQQITSETSQKQLEIKRLTELLQRKEMDIDQLTAEDRKNKTEIGKLNRELQEVRRVSQIDKERMIQKLNQYQFKVNRLLEEKQQFLLKLNQVSGDSLKLPKDSLQSPRNQLFRPANNQPQITKKQPNLVQKQPLATSQSTTSKANSSSSKHQSQQSQTPQQKLQLLIKQKQSLQQKLFHLNSQLTRIRQQIQNLNRQFSQSSKSSAISQNQQRKIEELECQYEQTQKMINFHQQTIRSKQTQILKLKKSIKTHF